MPSPPPYTLTVDRQHDGSWKGKVYRDGSTVDDTWAEGELHDVLATCSTFIEDHASGHMRERPTHSPEPVKLTDGQRLALIVLDLANGPVRVARGQSQHRHGVEPTVNARACWKLVENGWATYTHIRPEGKLITFFEITYAGRTALYRHTNQLHDQ